MLIKRVINVLAALFLTYAAHGNEIHIVDDNLRASIKEHLGISTGELITQQDMMQLTRLNAYAKGISNLAGLEKALNLQYLALGENPISDLSPLSSLPRLQFLILPNCDITDIGNLAGMPLLVELNLRSNPISDISALASLTTLKYLDLSHCQIVDVLALSQLINLEVLQLNHNKILDASPLASLSALRKLEIQRNLILDHSPLDSLTLDVFNYDQICDMPPLPLEPRIANRGYPSIVARWSGYGWPPITNRPELTDAENIAKHDLWFTVEEFGLSLDAYANEFRLTGDVAEAIRRRDELIQLNPNMIFLLTLKMRAADLEDFPVDWPYWLRYPDGKIYQPVGADGIVRNAGLIDFTHPDIQDIIVQQAISVSYCGLYDGIFFDFWAEEWQVLGGWDGTETVFFRTLAQETQSRLNIMTRIRAATRHNFLIMGNTNRGILPMTGSFLNGGFIEGVGSVNDIISVQTVLPWLERNLRHPQINALEGFNIAGESLDSPSNTRWMRALTALSLTHSNGYVLFTDNVDHNHHWYDFWDADLGRPVGEKGQLYDDDIPGLYIREYTNGWAVYNHSGAEQTVALPELASGVASGSEGLEHTLPNLDGEMYLRVKPVNPADVNKDGVVNILDLTIVAQGLGTDNLKGDVNGDGFVNILDLVFVADQF